MATRPSPSSREIETHRAPQRDSCHHRAHGPCSLCLLRHLDRHRLTAETAEENGISHFIEHMVFKGTKNRSAEEIARSVDSIGGGLDAFTAKEW